MTRSTPQHATRGDKRKELVRLLRAGVNFEFSPTFGHNTEAIFIKKLGSIIVLAATVLAVSTSPALALTNTYKTTASPMPAVGVPVTSGVGNTSANKMSNCSSGWSKRIYLLTSGGSGLHDIISSGCPTWSGATENSTKSICTKYSASGGSDYATCTRTYT